MSSETSTTYIVNRNIYCGLCIVLFNKRDSNVIINVFWVSFIYTIGVLQTSKLFVLIALICLLHDCELVLLMTMTHLEPKEECFFKALYSCQYGNLSQSSRVNTILSASRIHQYDIGLRPELSDGSLTVGCYLNCVSKYVKTKERMNVE